MTVVEHMGDTNLVATAMALCSDANLNDNNQAEGEPTECALVNFAYSVGLHKAELEAATPRVDEAPFDSGRKMMSTVHAKDGKFVQYTKGGPDVILGRCVSYLKDGQVLPMTEEAKAEILAANKAMADRALRVLAAAERIWDAEPASYEPADLEQELLEKITALGIGPQGFGGKTTALCVNIEKFPTHIAGLPVAVNINCHVTRHKSEVL
jgi:Ca2+-transporting ATPase